MSRSITTRRPPDDAPVQAGPDTYVCNPDPCPCLAGKCTLARMARARAGTVDQPDQPDLTKSEGAFAETLAQIPVDTVSMGAVTNIYRAMSALRNHFERTVLASYELTWTAWVVLWQVWTWQEIEAHHVAEEAKISKGTLTGVANTLEKRGLISRRTHPDDRRRILFSLTTRGKRLMKALYPKFNAEETSAMTPLTEDEVAMLATMMRKIIINLDEVGVA